MLVKTLSENNNSAGDLLMIMDHDPKRSWLIDLADDQAQLVDTIDIARFFNNNYIFFTDAKKTLSHLNLAPCPDFIPLCLSTIKKLLAKNKAQVLIPQFENIGARIAWAKKSAESAFETIQNAKLGSLIKLECQVIMVTKAMEKKGLPFDTERWFKELEIYRAECDTLTKRLHKYFGKQHGFALFGPEPLDLDNAQNVKKILEEILGVKLLGTSQSSLEGYDHEAVTLLLRYRECMRMLRTYGESFLSKVKDGRIHATFEPLGSASGRFACHDPNLQALPNDKAFQACVRALDPYCLLYFDYGAFELRILASLSKDKNLMAIFNDGHDIHSMVASQVFNCKVSKSENTHLRDQAKVLNFGIVYGMGEKALAKKLNTTIYKAEEMLRNYFARYPDVLCFLKHLEQRALKKGFVNTTLGRRLYFSSTQDKKSIGRIARNMPIQGTGADIAKLALCRVHHRLKLEKLDAHIVNMVHDEIVVECNKTIKEGVINLVREEMKAAFNVILPELPADVGVSM